MHPVLSDSDTRHSSLWIFSLLVHMNRIRVECLLVKGAKIGSPSLLKFFLPRNRFQFNGPAPGWGNAEPRGLTDLSILCPSFSQGSFPLKFVSINFQNEWVGKFATFKSTIRSSSANGTDMVPFLLWPIIRLKLKLNFIVCCPWKFWWENDTCVYVEWSIVGDDPILNVETEKAQFWSVKWRQEPDDRLFFWHHSLGLSWSAWRDSSSIWCHQHIHIVMDLRTWKLMEACLY